MRLFELPHEFLIKLRIRIVIDGKSLASHLKVKSFVLEKRQKSAVKHCKEVPIVLNFMNLCTDCLGKYALICSSARTPWNLCFTYILVLELSHFFLKLRFSATELRQRPKCDILQKALFYTLASG